jgi:hypothetical protein
MQEIADIVLQNWDTKGQTISQHKCSKNQKKCCNKSPEGSSDGQYKYITEWNPLLLAIFYNHMHIVRYFCEVVKVNLRSTLAMSKGGEHPLIFALAGSIVKQETTEIFQYVWNKFDYVWDYKCLK